MKNFAKYISVLLLFLTGCGISPSKVDREESNLNIKIAIPVNKGEFTYDVKIGVKGIDSGYVEKEWINIPAGEQTLSMNAPKGEDRIVEAIVYRNINGTRYPVYSAIQNVSIDENTTVELSLREMFQTTGLYAGVVSGKYPLKSEFAKFITGNGISSVSSNFTDLDSEYLINDITKENEFSNSSKIILKDWIYSNQVTNTPFFMFNSNNTNIVENLYSSNSDRSYLGYISPYGLNGYLISLYNYNATTGKGVLKFLSKDLREVRTENATLSFSGGISLSSTLNSTDTATFQITIQELANRTIPASCYYSSNFYPSLTSLFTNGTFEFNSNVTALLFPSWGENNGNEINVISYALSLNSTSDNTVTKNSYSFNETLKGNFLFATLGVEGLFKNYPSETLNYLKEGSTEEPVINYQNIEGFSSLFKKITITKSFSTFSGNLTTVNSFTITDGDTAVFEGITENGTFIKLKTPISLSGNEISLNLFSNVTIPDIDIKYNVLENGDTALETIIKTSYPLEFCDVKVLENEDRKYFPQISDETPLGLFYIFKGKKLSKMTFKRLPISAPYLFIPIENGNILKVMCYNSNKTIEVGKLFLFNGSSLQPLYSFQNSITDDGNITLDVKNGNLTVDTGWTENFLTVATDNDRIEISNSTIEVYKILNMNDPQIISVNFLKGLKKFSKINITQLPLGTASPTYSTLILDWDPANFSNDTNCKFNIVSSFGDVETEDWSMDCSAGTAEISYTAAPFIYAVQFCKIDSGNYTITFKPFENPLYQTLYLY